MIITNTTETRIRELLAAIDIPDSAYEAASRRYREIGNWLGMNGSNCESFEPEVSPQGSFRLGTVVKPLKANLGFDLDINCSLTKHIGVNTHSQKDLRDIVYRDLAAFRKARGIKHTIEEKRRCLRLQYADQLNFHLDIVPSIPATFNAILSLKEAISASAHIKVASANTADYTVLISDNRSRQFNLIHPDWQQSNPEGYALWFEEQMKKLMPLKESIELMAKEASVAKLPTFKWKSPLQRCVQLLKRHRDMMFPDDDDGKPISIIITTLSAKAYNGESDIADALKAILSNMSSLIRSDCPRVPNPVNPNEDFADKWYDKEYTQYQLEPKFWRWLEQAQTDFDVLSRETNIEKFVEHSLMKLGAVLNGDKLKANLSSGNPDALLRDSVKTTPGLTFPNKPLKPNKPAGFA